jgi:hypothetical protein
MSKKKIKIISSILVAIGIILGVIVGFKETGKIDKEEIHKAVDIIADSIETYKMSDEEIKKLPSTEIKEQTVEEEEATEQEVENEGFELQGEIAYEGDRARSWNVTLGDYKGLTYFSQIDNRWRYKMYSSVGDSSQTIGSSGCRTYICINDSNSNKRFYNTRYNVRLICNLWIQKCKPRYILVSI